jgi:ribosome maturation factor RimP
MPSPAPTLHGIDRDALVRVVEPIVRAHRAELVDLEFRPERAGWVLRLLVEKEGASERKLSTRDAAVDLDLCAGISRDLSPALDVADLIPHAYHLEVGSPGVERPLRGEDDFVRFVGHPAKLKVSRRAAAQDEPGSRVLVGTLGGVVNGCVVVHDRSGSVSVALSDVQSARLLFEFGRREPILKRQRG